MKAWLLHPAEPVPTDGDVRLFRYGALCRLLAKHGHHATQWASTFNHFTKTHRSREAVSQEVELGYQLELLPARAYKSHVGLARLGSQRDVAAAFAKRSRQVERPDVIVTSLPTLELAEAVLDYGREFGVPVLVDVRDLWPDFFLHPVPKLLRPLVKPFLRGFERQAERICAGATGLLGVSQEYLEWGLNKAQRGPQALDRVFHHAYTAPQLTPEQAQACARKFAEFGLNDDVPLRCCYFGTLGRSAGIDVLAQAARGVFESGHDDIQFVLCGGGPREKELLSKVADLPHVKHLGWVDSREIAWIMSRSHVGLAAYEAEVLQSLPNKPIEYLAGGLAVANTLPGELQALLSEYDCGSTFRPSESDRLAHWLIDMHDQPLQLARLARNARRLYREQFDASQVYVDFMNYLADVAGTHSTVDRRAA